MKRSKIELGRQGGFIFALLMIHFLFFGYIANTAIVFDTVIDGMSDYKQIGDRIVFLYQILFHPSTFFSFIILFGIVFYLVFKEQFYEYGIRNSFWLLPFILVESWIWYWVIHGFDISIIGIFFIRIEGYLTLIALFLTIFFAAI
ncbi:MAG: hypothetical protein ACFFDN_50980, partial [Candidatus Hodarchaeota archaeon]